MTVYYQDPYVTIHLGDCREILPTLDAGSIQTCVTSPPYFGLRDYGGAAQIGLEQTPAAYVAEMTGVFEQVRRVLRDDGSLWLNLGDSYCNTRGRQVPDSYWKGTDVGNNHGAKDASIGLKEKDLIGIPWRVAFALQDAGWWLRSEIIWHKPSAMPESVTDRPTKAHEQIFLLAKAERYYYDNLAIAEPAADDSGWAKQRANGVNTWEYNNTPERINSTGQRIDASTFGRAGTRNKRSVWSVTPAGFKGAHFAVFPEKLIEPCILAGAPERSCAACGAPWARVVERTGQIDLSAKGSYFDRGKTGINGNGRVQAGERYIKQSAGWQPSCQCAAATVPGVVLDPFGGSGTTARVAKRLGRRCILIEQNEQYAEMAAASLAQEVLQLW